MNKIPEQIAYCGLDCTKCYARTATLTDDDALREKTAKLWSQLNGIEITKEMINCLGCRGEGMKTYFCSDLCEIRKCAIDRDFTNCGQCSGFEVCEKLDMIRDNNTEASENLKKYRN